MSFPTAVLIGLLLWLATMLIMPLLIEQLEVVAGWLR